MTFGPLLFCNYFKTVLLAIARTCQYLVDLDLSNCHIINTGSFGILSKLTSLQVSISCSINIPSSLSQFSFYSEIDPSLPWDCYKVSSKLPRNWHGFIQKLPLFFYEMSQLLQVCTQGYHTVQNGRVILDKLPSTFDTWFGVYILWIFINNK